MRSQRLSEDVAQILVVEDDEQIREPLADLLVESGYRVAIARDGAEALRYLETAEAPQLILLDLEMPVLDGWAFCARVAEHSEWRTIPVVLMSGLAHQTPELPVATVGRLGKPVDLADLLEIVQQYC